MSIKIKKCLRYLPYERGAAVSRWLVSAGDNVASGDVIAEIETDKATMEVEGLSVKLMAE